LRAAPPELLITALRLREYNGLNLVYLAAGAGLKTRSIVFTDDSDSGMAREVRAAGAFYEVRARLAKALPAYISAILPPHDRRNVGSFERRRSGRMGGRRAADQPLNGSPTFATRFAGPSGRRSRALRRSKRGGFFACTGTTIRHRL
jgi:hypothetical protein